MLWLDPLSIKVRRQLRICSEYSLEKKKKKLFHKKSFELRCDLIIYPQRYVDNLEIILSIVTPCFKAIRANMIVHMKKKG
jgi:hypothetical protein